MGNHRNKNTQPVNNNDNNNNDTNSGSTGGQPNLNNLGQLLNNIDINQVMGQLSQMMGSSQQRQTQPQRASVNDPRLDLLQAMKPFLNTRRGVMIDKIGQLYAITRIIQGNNRKR